MFVLLKGATKEQAFKIGNEIADAVTATNPKPVKLKFEKVMLQQREAQNTVCQSSDCVSVCLRCTCPVCCKQRSAMWATCTRASTKRSRCTTPKGSRRFAATAAPLFPR